MPDIQIKTLKSSPNTCATLSEMLVETVANGGSVSFMHPLPFEAANEFWRNSLASADRGERIVLGAFDGEDLIGTVTLVLNLAQNQPHRAEIVKMMTRVSHRHRGIATLLLREAERIAIARGRWVCRLDCDICELNLRHRRSAPGQGHHISAGGGGFIGESRLRRRTEAEAVAGSEHLPRSAFDDDE